MEENLVIVESPAKAKTIEKFLGKDYLVTSSFGHIRDLDKKKFSIDVEKNYEPQYVIPEDKKKLVTELKKLAKNAQTVWLASDEDREGEAIAWHLSEVLNLKKKNTKRIVFHEITKNAILDAIKSPRDIDSNLVNAQQARRILDRMVGFELSPILWVKVKPSLSAGRVQSVAVRLLVDREREIREFVASASYKVTAVFITADKKGKPVGMLAELNEKFSSKEETVAFLNKCLSAQYKVGDLVTKPSRKSPAPPFTTSTLQQEASRKLGFSVSQTMSIAQKLYEAGKITYMRTDSVNLAETALTAAQEVITHEFGEKYVSIRKYKTKSKGAQEAHEAIRPTSFENETITGNNAEKRLYELIWKRTVASQMSEALLEKTTVTIDISTTREKFIATGEVLKFDGFLKLYIESTDEEDEENGKGLLPPIKVGQSLLSNQIVATERFTHYPPRYTEASLVKKMEELGIGRPSTYAPIISTIQQRGYVVKEDREGKERKYTVLTLKDKKIKEDIKTEITGAEKAKLFPNDIGMIVTDFLVEYFKDILDFNFTAKVEKEFDEIASGKLEWSKMIDKFYLPFHKKVLETKEKSQRSKGERILGTDPVSGKPLSVKIGKYGPIAQIGDKDDEEKPRFASLLKGQHIDSITLEEALSLFKYPRNLGKYEDNDVTVAIGRFGPYVKHDAKFFSISTVTDNPADIQLDRAIEIIEEKREKDRNKIIKNFKENPGLSVLNGRWGPYIVFEKKNYKIPKDKVPAELTLDDCMEIIKNSSESKHKKRTRKK
ncbi:MAG: type I DNA topoisomerase [Bacteroidota bacterium]|nr:type I DNA topoisomerase [Bacteroidota bacterium]